jgi:cystathionine gamma-synthase
MTHASTIGTPQQIPADLVRLSVGIEEPADLIADLTAGLAAARRAASSAMASA